MTFDTILSLVADLGTWHWLVLGALLIGVEAVMPSTYLLWPGIAAIVVGLIVGVDSDLGWQYQLLSFGILAIAASVVGRNWVARRGFVTDQPKLNRRSAQYVGRRAVVAETFAGGRGPISIEDTRWSAETVDGSNPEAGVNVEITAADGTVLKVRRLPV